MIHVPDSGRLVGAGRDEALAIARETVLHLGARIGNEGKGGGVSEVAAVDTQESVDLIACVANVLKAGVDGVDDQDDVNGIAAAQSLEGGNGLRGFVVEQREVLLRKTGYGRPGLCGNHDVQVDAAAARWDERSHLLRLLRLLGGKGISV